MVPFGRKNVIRHDRTQLHVLINTWITGEATQARERHCVDCGTYIDSAPREIYDVYMAAGSASSNRDGGLADRALKDTTITKRQLDLPARMMLESVSPLSDGNRAAESTTAFVLIRERPMHSEDNQTLSLRVVDPIVDEGVWAIIDDGWLSCAFI